MEKENSNKVKRRKKTQNAYFCTVCNKELKGDAELRRHASQHDIQFFCQIERDGNMVIEKTAGKIKKALRETEVKSHVCDYCGKAFKFLSYMKRHERLMHLKSSLSPEAERPNKIKKIPCEVCGKLFPFLSYMKRHLAQHCNSTQKKKSKLKLASSPKGPFSCSTCGKIFKVLKNFERHENLHTKSKKLSENPAGTTLHTCDICDKSYRFSSSLTKHKKKGHLQVRINKRISEEDKKKSCTCETCGKTYSSVSNLKLHENVHSRKIVYYCDICRQSFTHSSSLKQHYFVHTGERPFQCKICGRCFAKNHALKLHIRLHSGNLPFKCDQCDKAYNTKADLRNHVINHTGVYPLKCDKCNKGFRKKRFLQAHIDSQTCVNKKPGAKVVERRAMGHYPCEVCSKVFRRKGNLERHLPSHDGEYPFHCQICNMGFIGKKNFQFHSAKHDEMLKETGKVKSQKECDICGKKFSKPYYLREHYRSHTGEYPYECSYCQKKFNFKGSLNNHVAAIHTKDYPLRCTICDQGFCKKHKLRDHMRTHFKKNKIKLETDDVEI